MAAGSLNLERLEECEASFNKFSKNGVVSSRNLARLLHSVGQEPKEKFILARMKQKEAVTLDEFVKIVTTLVDNKKKEALMHESFALGKKQKAAKLRKNTSSAAVTNSNMNLGAKKALNNEGSSCCTIS